jgi:hypothetical protein
MREEGILKKKSIDVIDSWESFKYSCEVNADLLKKDAKRNVKARFIVGKPKDGETVPKIFQTLKKNGRGELKYVPTQPQAMIRIEDEKRVVISIITAKHMTESPSLFSDNPCLVTILQDYFERVWSEATEANT